MSKKFFKGCTGCVGAFVIVLVIGGFLAYYFIGRPVMNGLETFQEVHETNEKIENRASYSPPSDGTLQEEQVERFVDVQRQIREGLEQRLGEMEEKYEQINNEWEQREPTYREAIAVWSDLGRLYADAKEIQVEALNEEGFSLEEYRYVRSSFYRSLGFELIDYNLDSIAEAASEGDLGTDFERFRSEWEEIPQESVEKNRELVSQYADGAEEWMAFAWWGL